MKKDSTKIKRTFFDRLFGLNKRYDDIIIVRNQIRKIINILYESEHTEMCPYTRNLDYKKYAILISRFNIDEKKYCSQFNKELLYISFLEIRNQLIEMLSDKVDLSDIIKEIQDRKY